MREKLPGLGSETTPEDFEEQEQRNHPDNLIQGLKVNWDFNKLKHLVPKVPNTLGEVRKKLEKFNVVIDKRDGGGFTFKAEIPALYDRRIRTIFIISGSGEGSIDDPQSMVDELTTYSTTKTTINKDKDFDGFPEQDIFDSKKGVNSIEVQKFFDIERNRFLFERKIEEWKAGEKYPFGAIETIEKSGGGRILHEFISGVDFQESWKMPNGQVLSIKNTYERDKSFSIDDELGDILSKINPIYNNVIGLLTFTINNKPVNPQIFREALQEALLWIDEQKREGFSIEAIQ